VSRRRSPDKEEATLNKRIVLGSVVALWLALPHMTRAQDWPTALHKIYKDEAHCLVPTEIRGEKDRPISCSCRDTLTDARYVYQTYLLTGKDRNLNGSYLTLEQNASQWCGKSYDVWAATRGKAWRWDGPEVVRRYPTDSEIEQLKPNRFGARAVRYMVELIYRDSRGRRLSTGERFSAVEWFPPKGNK
jgi:hypothetical protein